MHSHSHSHGHSHSHDDWDDNAETWDEDSREQRALLVDRVKNHVEFTHISSLLDFGAGTGAMAREVVVASEGNITSVTLIDTSEKMLQVASQRSDFPESVVRKCCATMHEIGKMQVDLAISTFVLHHIEDAQQTFTSIAGHVRPSGLVVIAEFAHSDQAENLAKTGHKGVKHGGFTPEILDSWAAANSLKRVQAIDRFDITFGKNNASMPCFLWIAQKLPWIASQIPDVQIPHSNGYIC